MFGRVVDLRVFVVRQQSARASKGSRHRNRSAADAGGSAGRMFRMANPASMEPSISRGCSRVVTWGVATAAAIRNASRQSSPSGMDYLLIPSQSMMTTASSPMGPMALASKL